jgi:hypothetical protein
VVCLELRASSTIAIEAEAIVLPRDKGLLFAPQVLEQKYGTANLKGAPRRLRRAVADGRLAGASQLALRQFQMI